MPKVRRHNLPEPLFRHLARRVRERRIQVSQLGLLRDWLLGEPEVPAGPWFKDFDDFIVCGEGEFVTTFLLRGQIPTGTKL